PAPKAAGSTQADRDRAALRQFPEVNRAVKNVSPVIDRAARNHAAQSVQKATGNGAVVTSRDRPPTSRIASPAHDRGAVDVVTPNMKQSAPQISRQVGPGYTTIHEQPKKTATGASYDRHTVYQNGAQVSSKDKPARATGEHIHVQPDFNSRLHQAASSQTPKTNTSTPTSRDSRVSNAPSKPSTSSAPAKKR